MLGRRGAWACFRPSLCSTLAEYLGASVCLGPCFDEHFCVLWAFGSVQKRRSGTPCKFLRRTSMPLPVLLVPHVAAVGSHTTSCPSGPPALRDMTGRGLVLLGVLLLAAAFARRPWGWGQRRRQLRCLEHESTAPGAGFRTNLDWSSGRVEGRAVAGNFHACVMRATICTGSVGALAKPGGRR